MPPPHPRRAETRARLLAAACTLLVEGDGHLEMAALAQAAGTSHGLAYHHFRSKEGLLCAVVEDFYDRVEAAVLRVPGDPALDWAARERARTLRYIDFLLCDPVGRVLTTRLAHTPAVAAVEAARWARLIADGARNVTCGQRAGVVGAQQPSDRLSAMILGAARAAVVQALTQDPAPDAAQLTDDIWSFLAGGLSLRAPADTPAAERPDFAGPRPAPPARTRRPPSPTENAATPTTSPSL